MAIFHWHRKCVEAVVDERRDYMTSMYPGGFVGIDKQWQEVTTCGTSPLKRQFSWRDTTTGLSAMETVEFRDTLQIGE